MVEKRVTDAIAGVTVVKERVTIAIAGLHWLQKEGYRCNRTELQLNLGNDCYRSGVKEGYSYNRTGINR